MRFYITTTVGNMPRKANIIAIIGYANYDFLDEIQRKKIFTLGYELGKSLIDNGYIIATGGLGGVMKDVSQGARDSKAYKQGCILGILPNYDSNQANDFVDIALPTGFDVGRNITLVSIAKAVIMLGGGAGSLNEVALAWQLQKLIIALGDIGWAGKLADMPLDSRRNDRIFKASSVSEVLELLQTKILLYQRNFSGIKNTSSREKALHTLTSTFTLKDIEYLGGGSEGHCLFICVLYPFIVATLHIALKCIMSNPKRFSSSHIATVILQNSPPQAKEAI